jgi:hypothetical protein
MTEEMTNAIIMSLNNIGLGLFFIALSIPLLKGHVKMNRVYGIRVRKAFESDERWYKVNRYGAKQIIIWSLVLIANGIVAFFIPIKGESDVPILFAVLLAPALIWIPIIIQTLRFCKKQE